MRWTDTVVDPLTIPETEAQYRLQTSYTGPITTIYDDLYGAEPYTGPRSPLCPTYDDDVRGGNRLAAFCAVVMLALFCVALWQGLTWLQGALW